HFVLHSGVVTKVAKEKEIGKMTNDGVRIAGSKTTPELKDDEIVTSAADKYEIFMHQLAPNVIVGLSLKENAKVAPIVKFNLTLN
ncbi:hypothetical protein ACJX0J_039777, partial [Zea mays]